MPRVKWLYDPFVLNLLNIANCYIFKCQSVINIKNGVRIPGFFDELVPFLVVYLKIGKFQLVT